MKKIIKLILIFILFSTINVHALAPTDLERTESNNYGVNKKWKITDKNLNNILSTHYVDVSEKIYDYSEILTKEEIEDLKQMIDDFKSKTNMEFIIVTDNLPYSNDKENQDYAADFYDYNDFGITEENYSGVLFFRNTYSQDPYYYVLTSGTAQLYFDQVRIDNVLDNIYYDISSKRYYNGISKLISSLESYYERGIDQSMAGYTIDDTGHLKEPPYQINWISVLAIATVITVCVMFILIKKNKMIKLATEAKEYLDESSINITRQEDRFIHTKTTSYHLSDSSGSGGGGSSFSGSSGGGHGGGGRHG